MSLTELGTGSGLYVLTATVSDACDQLRAWGHRAPAERFARLIRGGKCRTWTALFDEFAAALQFPCYFGGNWDAFDECLTDLEGPPASAYLLLISSAAHVLDKDPLEQRKIFWQTLQRRMDAHLEGKHPGFQVVAQATAQELGGLRRGLESAGANYHMLP
jgi:hypothetical protein